MLNATLKPHREFLLAQQNGQKLFLALTLRPNAEAAGSRPNLNIVFVVDTSGSMREVVTQPTEVTNEKVRVDGQDYNVVKGAKSKMDLVIESMRSVISSDLLLPEDRLALVKFDDNAEVLVPFTSSTERARLLSAAERLTHYSGGTMMGAGLKQGARLLEAETGSRRLVVLTDGETFDEAVVKEQIQKLADARVPISVVGVGDFKYDLLLEAADKTQGQLFDVKADNENPKPPAIRATDLPAALLGDLKKASLEVVTEVGLTVRAIKDVTLERITRVVPTQTEVDMKIQPHALGNIEAGVGSTFILEFTLPARPPARMRLAQIGLTYQVPGANYRGEVPPLEVVVEFTADEARAASVNSEVMQWVQQRNIEMLVMQATREAVNNPEAAAKTLEQARSMTVRLGNSAMTQALDSAIGELSGSKTISLGTAKTLRLGSKTQTLQGNDGSIPSDEEIRRITGA
jgi:Ca-activated chloride channel homolog